MTGALRPGSGGPVLDEPATAEIGRQVPGDTNRCVTKPRSAAASRLARLSSM